MVFGFFKRKKEEKPGDPLAVFDHLIDSIERQSSAARKSAATLLALRAELHRDQEKYRNRVVAIEGKRPNADPAVLKVLGRDQTEAQRLLERTDEALAQAEADASLLMETAEELGRQLQELKEERQSARVRFSGSSMVTDALKVQAAQFEKVMQLDAARDEVEKAHALAELYREDRKR
ncbi:MAG: hypothetical protein DI536_05775 [Archangium gephyra]|uniref:PspA/IM30 family protein n=1 Tax=Archangium gephyra TaxID=48 RepID=A0A2W5VLB9_9BACT|nr:MAG: hypothetical protein DI536_05775 [Archangium gephyra]